MRKVPGFLLATVVAAGIGVAGCAENFPTTAPLHPVRGTPQLGATSKAGFAGPTKVLFNPPTTNDVITEVVDNGP